MSRRSSAPALGWIEQELALACDLACACNFLQLEEVAVPLARLEPGRLAAANRMWRELLGTAFPLWASSELAVVLGTGTPRHLGDVHVQGRWLAATIVRSVDRNDTAVIASVELTDLRIARELHIALDALVWSGRVATPALADYASASLTRYTGSTAVAAWQVSLHGDDIVKWPVLLAEALERGSATADVRLLGGDGRGRWFRVDVVIRGSRWFAIAHDCEREYVLETERTQLLERVRAARIDAEQAHRMKDQVLAAVSHELRGPVTTMMLWERVLRDPGADAASRARALDAIHQSAAAQSRMVADLIDVSRAFSGKLYVDFRRIELARTIAEVVDSFIPAAREKDVDLESRITFTGEISADAARLRQVLHNLISNALKFSDPGGRVVVSTQQRGRLAVIEVKDRGQGIAAKDLNRIFEPFAQGGDPFARHEGLGLGLAIAKQIVELHHGTLTAYSEGPQRGARFTITLPVVGHHRAPSPPIGVTSPTVLKQLHVLVVDNDVRVLNALAVLLDRAGAIVDRAESAAAAREHIARRAPQVIVCDIVMPHEDGYAFMRSLRAAGNTVPAIALTGYAAAADAEQALAAGFDLHVTKPVDFQRLVTSLSQVLGERVTPM